MKTGFSFKGIHTDSFNITVKTKSRPILPEQKQYIVNAPCIDGSYDFSSANAYNRPFYEDRVFENEISITACDIYELQRKISTLAVWIMGEGDLIYDDMPDVIWTAKIVNSIDFAPKIYGTQAIITIQFRVKTWSKSKFSTIDLDNLILDTDIPLNSKFQLDMSEFFEFNLLAGTNNITIKNIGTAYTTPSLLISGQASGITISHNYGKLQVKQPFNGVYIDCENQQIISGENNINVNCEGDFFTLTPGDNMLAITTTSPISMIVKYMPQFIYNCEWGF